MRSPTMDFDRRDFLCRMCALAGALGGSARTNATPGPSASEFDYVVVGAGSAGCVLANRLSSDPSVRVLLLEAGGSGGGERLAVPGRWLSLLGSDVDWRYATVPQDGLLGRSLAWPRGKVLGGSSAINAMAYVRGHRADFDGWRTLGNAGWGYEEVLPLFTRSEDNTRGASRFHGTGGPLAVSDTADPNPAHTAFLESARALGFEASPAWDFNGERQENGAGFYQKNIRAGRRDDAATAFLGPILSRSNLTVRTGAHAVAVRWTGRRALGVEYLVGGVPHVARARRETVLCAGVVESPRILARSGVASPDALTRARRRVVADSPEVGRNLQDHLRVSIVHRSGAPLAASSVSAGLFVRSPGCPRDAPPDLHFYVGRGVDTPSPALVITVALGRPASRGAIRVDRVDSAMPPAIDPRYLESDADLDRLVAGVRLARELARGAAFDRVRGEELEPGPGVTSDADIAAFVRRAADTIFHPAGTCRMGADPRSVVDPSLRVRGVEGLRVADASIMPVVVNAPTHAACVMIGEKAADLLTGAG